jgi:acyl-CoA synthetase (NDP forming)
VPAAEVASAFQTIMEAGKAAGVAAAGVLVQEMVGVGLEILVGVRIDPSTGPLLTVGLGGLLAEALRDTAVEVAPITRSDAAAMLRRLRAHRLFEGFRTLPRPDTDALIDLLVAFGEFAFDAQQHIAEMDLNPVIVLPNGRGCVVADAGMVLA